MDKVYIEKILPFLDKDLVVYDLETTGADTSTDEIVQFGGTRIFKNGKIKNLQFLCKPSIEIEPDATEVHGISNEDVADAPPFSSFCKQVADFFNGADVGGYNIVRFDVPILDRQMSENGYPDIFSGAYFYDSYRVFTKHVSRKLEDALRYYCGKEIEDAHDAMGDVKSTIMIASEQLALEDKSTQTISEEFFPLPSERIGVTNHIILEDGKYILTFGKHKGIPIEKVDKGYLAWIDKSDFPEPVKAFVRKYY